VLFGLRRLRYLNLPNLRMFLQVALKLARGESKSPAASIDLYEKYSMCSKPIRDACFVGQSAITMFDHLVSSSLNEGFFR